MQDRIDELQAELRDFHSLGRVQQAVGQPLSEELESKSPGMESDPGKNPLEESRLAPRPITRPALLPEQVSAQRKSSPSA